MEIELKRVGKVSYVLPIKNRTLLLGDRKEQNKLGDAFAKKPGLNRGSGLLGGKNFYSQCCLGKKRIAQDRSYWARGLFNRYLAQKLLAFLILLNPPQQNHRGTFKNLPGASQCERA